MTWGLIILYYSGGHGHGLGIDMENLREAGDGRASKFRAEGPGIKHWLGYFGVRGASSGTELISPLAPSVVWQKYHGL